jgi:ribosomal protein S18 acetylase RimI-like enzyme
MPEDAETAAAIDADRAIMACIRESRKGRDLSRVGPFLILFTPATKLTFLNYAIPDDDADPSVAEIETLIAAFRDADRMPRLEFLPTAAPALEAALVGAGFTVEGRLPLMTCTSKTVLDIPVPDGVSFGEPSDAPTLLAMVQLQHDIFEDPEPVDERTVARARANLDRGGRGVVCADLETPAVVGAAQVGVPAGGATEVVGVVVAPSHRRRGIAAAMVSALARQSFAAGLATVFLEVAPGAGGAYANAGFRRTSTSVHISLQGDAHA